MLAIHLLGRPRIERGPEEVYQFRSRKSWALLAYLLLGDRPPTRGRLAGLLFADADDPLRALRWSLAEIRRALGGHGTVDGDPVTLELDDARVDAALVTGGTWQDAVQLPGLGADLLDGVTLRGAAGFETWLLSERRRLAAASEAILHEAALGRLAEGELEAARGLAVRAVALNPLDEDHQALVVRLYRLAGDDAGAERQYAACVDLFARELGTSPGPALEAALRETTARDSPAVDDAVSVEALVEAGTAAISAGATQAGLQSLRTAVRWSDRARHPRLGVAARQALAEALIHAVGGFDDDGQAVLHEADRRAVAAGDTLGAARARAELGYVDYLRARYGRAERWLLQARQLAPGSPSVLAKTATYLGVVESDRADYPRARRLLEEAAEHARTAGEPRREAYVLAASGRISLLLGELEPAAEQLTASIELAQRDAWLAFLPWPQSLLGEAQLLRGDVATAEATLEQAYARACRIGDPCWEGISTRGLGLLAEQRGEHDRAFALLADARTRGRRLTDSYVWLDVYILDALCTLGRRHGHPATDDWIATMSAQASRTGMRELLVRALVHRSARGGRPRESRDGGDGGAAGAAEAAALLGSAIENPRLHELSRSPGSPD